MIKEYAREGKPTTHEWAFMEKKTHAFDFSGEQLLGIKQLFPEFKLPKSTNPLKVQGLAISDLRFELQQRLQVPVEMIDRALDKIDRKNANTVFWNEFLVSLTEEGRARETVADATLFGFGVKRFEFQKA